jgi:hypothetical protein
LIAKTSSIYLYVKLKAEHYYQPVWLCYLYVINCNIAYCYLWLLW